MAGQRKPKSQQLVEVVRTRLTATELRAFEAGAAKLGLSVSAWLRSLAIRALAESKS